jgi:hypothetical protein
MASLLINDAPLYHSDAPLSLACTVGEALAALERGQRTVSIIEC